jgi:hypothetical protein
MTFNATLAVDISGSYGYVIQYAGMPGALHGEYRDELEFLDAIDGLLQNGFTWRVLLGCYATADRSTVSGALWYLAARHGAEFHEVPVPVMTDGQLNKARLWRRGMSAANRAARLIYEGPIEETT